MVVFHCSIIMANTQPTCIHLQNRNKMSIIFFFCVPLFTEIVNQLFWECVCVRACVHACVCVFFKNHTQKDNSVLDRHRPCFTHRKTIVSTSRQKHVLFDKQIQWSVADLQMLYHTGKLYRPCLTDHSAIDWKVYIIVSDKGLECCRQTEA